MALTRQNLVICLIIFVTDCNLKLQTTASEIDASDEVADIAENILNGTFIFGGPFWKTKILSIYPDFIRNTSLILNRTLSESKSICEVIRENFMDKQCNSKLANDECYENEYSEKYSQECLDIVSLKEDDTLSRPVFHTETSNAKKKSSQNAAGILSPAKMLETQRPVASQTFGPTGYPEQRVDPTSSVVLSDKKEHRLQSGITHVPLHSRGSPLAASLLPNTTSATTPVKHTLHLPTKEPMEPTTPTDSERFLPPPITNYYFLAVGIITRTVKLSHARWCHIRNGVFDIEKLACKLPMSKNEDRLPLSDSGNRKHVETESDTPSKQEDLTATTMIPSTAIFRKKSHLFSRNIKSGPFINSTWFNNRNMTRFNYSMTTHEPQYTTWLNRTMVWSNSTVIYFTNPAWWKAVKIINISGHSCSILCLFLLIITFFLLKAEFTLMDKNLLCLSTSLLFAHLLQLNMVFFSAIPMFCKWGAVFLHLSLLVSFMWIASISFDLCITFKGNTRITPHIKNERFKKYFTVVYGLSGMIVVVCVAIGLPSEDFSGYGDQGKCFVVKFWSNLLAFTVPIVIILLASVILTVLTIYSLYSEQKRNYRALSNGTSGASARKKIIFTALVLKLSILCGFGWLIGFINGFFASVPLSVMFNIIVSLQGTFLYLFFGEQKSLVKKCFMKMQHQHQREAVAKEAANYQATAV